MSAVEVHFLHEGGQSVEAITDELVAFIEGATKTLDVALYDARFVGAEEQGARILAALKAADSRGVQTRAVYNDDDGPTAANHPRRDRDGPDDVQGDRAGYRSHQGERYEVRDGPAIDPARYRRQARRPFRHRSTTEAKGE